MKNEKSKEILYGYLIVFLTFSGLFLFGRLFKIITPIQTWKPAIQIWISDRFTNKDDSIYLSCLNENADIFERKGYDRRELKTRKRILDYYIGKGDVYSVDYAVAKIKFLIKKDDGERYCEYVRDAKDILWTAWKKRLLDDSEKELLFTSIIMLTRAKPAPYCIQEFVDALAVSEDISDVHKKEYLRTSVCITLAMIYATDISTLDKAQIFVDQLNPVLIDNEQLRMYAWMSKVRCQLCLHNVILAQQYLDIAKDEDYHDYEVAKQITSLQYAIYVASGDLKNASKERKHLMTLKYGNDINSELDRLFFKFEDSIRRKRKLRALRYKTKLNRNISSCYENYKKADVIDDYQKFAYKKLFARYILLIVEYGLTFDAEMDYELAFNKLDSLHDILPTEQQLQLINFRMRAALKYPSDSTNVIVDKCFAALQNRLQISFPYMTDGERTSFWSVEEPVLRNIYAGNCSAETKYNSALLCKGLLLTASNNFKRSIVESKDSMLINDWNQLQFLRQAELLNMDFEKIGDFAIQNRADSLEHSIAKRSIVYQHYMNTWNVSWKDVQQQLQDDDCAIEIISYPKNKDIQYDALVLRKNDKAPVCVHIGKESFLSKEGSDILFKRKSSFIEAFLKSIRPYLTPGNIFISMDGIFHYKNIEAMVADSEGNLLSDLYSIVRVSSTRDIAVSSEKTYKSASLFGGIEYNITEKERNNNAKRYRIARENTPRGLLPSGKRNKKLRFEYLPYSLAEVKSIKDILSSQGFSTSLYTKKTACEDAFKDMSGKSKQIIHISTHGLMNNVTDKSDDPMRQCCLLFAGAVNSLKSKQVRQNSDYQDGILTAAEIATLDLRGTDLVVLSACNTGKGRITSDGVFGLQRAFKQAGAKSIVMSLRSVDDEMTARFMVDFYKQLAAGNDVRTAFATARKDMRRKYPDSLDWAAFILLD